MNTTKLHDSIKMAYEVDPRHPSLPFMEAATAILEEHELRLGILSGHIILERCKPHEDPGVLSREEVDSLLKATEEWDHEQREDEKPKTLCSCVRCGEPAQYGRIYCKKCVPVAMGPGPESELEPEPGDFHEDLAAASLDEVARLRAQVEGDAGLIRYLWRAKEDAAERHAALVCASGEWNVERGRLMAERDEALKRVEQARQEGLDEGVARTWEAAAKDVDALRLGEEESKGEGGGSGTTQEPGAPVSPTRGACDREASSPTLVCSQCGKPGAHFVPPSLGESGFYVCDPREVVQGRQESVGRKPAETRRGLSPPQCTESLSPGTEGDCASSSPTPTLREEVMAFLDGWGVGTGTTCGDAVSEVLDSWEAQHRKMREAARTMCFEAPKSVRRLRGEGCPGHAAILEAAADRLEASLKEVHDATL